MIRKDDECFATAVRVRCVNSFAHTKYTTGKADRQTDRSVPSLYVASGNSSHVRVEPTIRTRDRHPEINQSGSEAWRCLFLHVQFECDLGAMRVQASSGRSYTDFTGRRQTGGSVKKNVSRNVMINLNFHAWRAEMTSSLDTTIYSRQPARLGLMEHVKCENRLESCKETLAGMRFETGQSMKNSKTRAWFGSIRKVGRYFFFFAFVRCLEMLD